MNFCNFFFSSDHPWFFLEMLSGIPVEKHPGISSDSPRNTLGYFFKIFFGFFHKPVEESGGHSKDKKCERISVGAHEENSEGIPDDFSGVNSEKISEGVPKGHPWRNSDWNSEKSSQGILKKCERILQK